MKTLVLCLLLFGGCSGIVSVEHHKDFMGPQWWEITDGKTSVSIYNGDCCCVAGKIADTAAARINRGEYEWPIESQRWNELIRVMCGELIEK